MYKLSLPLKLALNNKTFYLNLNVYRNTHFYLLNKAKHQFKEEIASQLKDLPKFNQIELTYIIYPATKRLFDLANVGSIVDKFFCDALVELGHLPDDNYTYLKKVSFSFGSVDKSNPRAEVHIEGD